jgi:beta-lactamase class D
MANYTITLSNAEDKALGYISVSQLDWINNVVHERCRIAIEEIVAAEVQRKLAANETISGTKDDIVMAAPIKSAAENQAEFLTQLQQGS